MPSTLPHVDVDYVEFKRSCVVDGDCEFTLVAPHNDQKFLATEQFLYSNDKDEVTDISTKIQNFSDSISQSTGHAQTKMGALSKKLQTIQEQLNLYQSQLLQTQQNLDDTEYQLQFSNLYINMISINQQLCYYECLAPPTTAPPASTTTETPTTSPGACSVYECDNGGGDCTLDKDSIPYCGYCPGNLDGRQHCDTGACLDSGMNVNTNATEPVIYFYSPGWFGPNKDFKVPPQDLHCLWTLSSSTEGGGYNASQFDFSKLDSATSTLYFYTPNGAKIQASNTFTLKKLLSVLSESPITVEFQTKSGSLSSFFFDMTEL